MRSIRHSPIFVLAFALAACGHNSAPADDAGASQAQAQAQAPASPESATVAPDPSAAAQANATSPLQVGDLDAYAKGMQKEIELRQAASDRASKAKAAKDQTAEVNALAEITSAEINDAGAQAAGMDAARYGFVKNTIDRVLNAVWMGKAMAKMEGGAQLQRNQGDPYAALDADVAKALKAREAELGKLREDNMAILANAQNL